MKRTIAFLLVLVMVLSFAACGGGETPQTSDAPSGGAQTEQPSQSGGEKPLAGKSVAICTATATHGFNSELIVHAQNTVKRLAGEYGFDYKLVTYQEHALTKSSSSSAIAYVGIETPNGKIHWGAAIDPDIIRASIDALLTAINHSVK